MKEVKPITFYGFVLNKTIGTGAYAKVKEGHSIKEDSRVAVKIIDREKAGEDVIEKFTKREIDIMRSLDHPNIVATHEVVMNDKFIFIVMDLAESGDLLDFVIARQYLDEDMAQHFFQDLISGMQYIHRNGFAHRDLKCENLLIDKNYNLKISDFGFSTQLTHRRCETYCGSLAYAAPEVIDGKPYIATFSDIWSMGVVLYAMVIGKLPFTETELTAKKGTDRILNLNFPRMLTDNCVDILYSILDSSPAQRIQLNKMQEHKWMIRKKSSDVIREELRSESEESNLIAASSNDSYKTAINCQTESNSKIQTTNTNNSKNTDTQEVKIRTGKRVPKKIVSRNATPEPRNCKTPELRTGGIKRKPSKQKDIPSNKKNDFDTQGQPGKVNTLTDKMLDNLNKLKHRNKSI